MTQNRKKRLKWLGGAVAAYLLSFWAFVYRGYLPVEGSGLIPFTFAGFTERESYRSAFLEHGLLCIYYPVYQIHRMCGVKVIHLDEPVWHD